MSNLRFSIASLLSDVSGALDLRTRPSTSSSHRATPANAGNRPPECQPYFNQCNHLRVPPTPSTPPFTNALSSTSVGILNNNAPVNLTQGVSSISPNLPAGYVLNSLQIHNWPTHLDLRYSLPFPLVQMLHTLTQAASSTTNSRIRMNSSSSTPIRPHSMPALSPASSPHAPSHTFSDSNTTVTMPARRMRWSTRPSNRSRQYDCNQCDGTFKHHYELRQHTEEKHGRFRCHTCNTEFTRFSNLQRHANIHTKVMRFQCRACRVAFDRTDHIKRHIEHVHPRLPIPDAVIVIRTEFEDFDKPAVQTTRNLEAPAVDTPHELESLNSEMGNVNENIPPEINVVGVDDTEYHIAKTYSVYNPKLSN